MLITHNKSVRLTKKRSEVLDAAKWAAEKLGLHKAELTINIVFTHLFLKTFSVHAETHYTNKNRITILFDANPHKYLHLNTIMHEIVHCKQFHRGQLGHNDAGELLWKGKTQPADLPYWLQPWEIEAMQKADLMAIEYALTMAGVTS